MKDDESLVADVLRSSAWHWETIRIVRQLNLPDWAIGAGFVRNAVWDHLHGFAEMTPLNDIDVLYFDPVDLTIGQDMRIEEELFAIDPDRPWSVHNQARMHIRNNDQPYNSTVDAISYWLETATRVAITMDSSDQLTIIAPSGLSDLIGLQSRPTAAAMTRAGQYRERMVSKNWPGTWPKVTVLGLS